jgi:hypothetical protein
MHLNLSKFIYCEVKRTALKSTCKDLRIFLDLRLHMNTLDQSFVDKIYQVISLIF